MRLILNLLVVVVALGSLQSCVSKKKYDELAASKDAVDAALTETQGKVAQLEEDNASLKSEMESEKTRLNGELSSLRNDLNSTKSQVAQVQEKLNMTEKELAEVKAQIDGIFAAYDNSGLSLEERDGRLYVLTDPGLQYRSGSFSLTRDERKALEELAETLKGNANLKILVEGHTDDDGVLATAPYADNWELSTKRALRVVRELIRLGVDPAQVAAVGRGETMPKASNEDEDGKAQNRRTELLADPNLKTLKKSN